MPSSTSLNRNLTASAVKTSLWSQYGEMTQCLPDAGSLKTRLVRDRPPVGSTDLQSLGFTRIQAANWLPIPDRRARHVTNSDYGIYCIAHVQRVRYFYCDHNERWRSWVSVGSGADIRALKTASVLFSNRTFKAGL